MPRVTREEIGRVVRGFDALTSDDRNGEWKSESTLNEEGFAHAFYERVFADLKPSELRQMVLETQKKRKR